MKAKNKLISTLFCFIFSLLTTGCQQDEQQSRWEQEIKNMKAKVFTQTPKHNLLSEKFISESGSYEVEKLRDPFETPHVISKPTTTDTNPLNAFPLSELRFIGVISEKDAIVAIIMTPDDHIYQVKLGDQIGNQYGKIVNITQSQIDVVETMTDESNHPIQRTVAIRFKG